MSRDVLTVGSTMRISLLYRGEYSQWVERLMNYLEEQTNREAMINLIKNGDQPLPRVTQVSIARTTSTEQPPLKDKLMWSDQEKRVQKIDHYPDLSLDHRFGMFKVYDGSKSENQTENDCLVVEKVCDKEKNPNVIAHGMFKLNVSQCVSPIPMSKSSCDSKKVEIKLKRKRRETTSASVCNDAMNVSCNPSMCDLVDDNNFFIFDDVNVRISPVSKMHFRKSPRDSMHKVYYVEGLGHNLFSVGQFCDKGFEVAFRKSTCFVQNEDGVDLLTGDRSSNLYTIALNEVASNISNCLLAKASSLQSGLATARMSMQDEPKGVPINRATRFENKLCLNLCELWWIMKKMKMKDEFGIRGVDCICFEKIGRLFGSITERTVYIHLHVLRELEVQLLRIE
nr:integrase, catalytic region, zinc finger, CCHC-type, peptidase aspartic, catalytic [Tanacetum cinerariifolium]